MKQTIAIAFLATTLLAIAIGCGSSPTSTPTPTTSASNTPTPSAQASPGGDAEAGLALFRAKGCASCHGQNAEGGFGPALAGHTRDQVIKQVRTPVGAMPSFSVSELSDEELEDIVAFILELEGDGDGHMDNGGMMH